MFPEIFLNFEKKVLVQTCNIRITCGPELCWFHKQFAVSYANIGQQSILLFLILIHSIWSAAL